jgi:hypothetical protein
MAQGPAVSTSPWSQVYQTPEPKPERYPRFVLVDYVPLPDTDAARLEVHKWVVAKRRELRKGNK